jgi:antitoxin YefM
MLATNFTTVRDNFKNYCDKVTNDCETIIVTRKNEKNVVIMSLDQYNNMMENLFIFANKPYHDKLVKSAKQIERGQVVTKTMEELEHLADE